MSALLPKGAPSLNVENVSDAATVVAPDTANDMYPEFPVLLLSLYRAPNITIADVPVVSVTDGPDVARSVYDVDDVPWSVVTVAESIAVTTAVVGPTVIHDEPL